jgi:hypothetical protein
VYDATQYTVGELLMPLVAYWSSLQGLKNVRAKKRMIFLPTVEIQHENG